MNKEENLLAQIRWVPGNPNLNGEYGLGQLPSERSDQSLKTSTGFKVPNPDNNQTSTFDKNSLEQIDVFNKRSLNEEIKAAMYLLINNGYRVEKILRSDESFALSK